MTPSVDEFSAAAARIRAGGDLDDETDRFLVRLTQDEKVFLLDGDVPLWEGMASMTDGCNRVPFVKARPLATMSGARMHRIRSRPP